MRHRLWAVTDPAQLAAVAADLAPRQALIADGHHRYAAYLQLQAGRRRPGRGLRPARRRGTRAGAAGGLGGLPAADRRDPPGDARAQRPGQGGSAWRRPRSRAAAARRLPGPGPAGRAGPAARGRRRGLPGGRRCGRGHRIPAHRPGPACRPRRRCRAASATWRGLAASVLQELLIARLWGIRDDERSVQERARCGGGAAVAEAGKSGGTAVICAPMSAAEVYTVAAHGERVPRKSTSFAPKPRTGLVHPLVRRGLRTASRSRLAVPGVQPSGHRRRRRREVGQEVPGEPTASRHPEVLVRGEPAGTGRSGTPDIHGGLGGRDRAAPVSPLWPPAERVVGADAVDHQSSSRDGWR